MRDRKSATSYVDPARPRPQRRSAEKVMAFKSLGSNLEILIFEKKCELFFDGVTVALPQSGARGGARYQKTGFFLLRAFPKVISQPNHNPLTPHASPDPPPGAGAAPFQGKLDLSGKSQPIPNDHPGHFFVFLHFFQKKCQTNKNFGVSGL